MSAYGQGSSVRVVAVLAVAAVLVWPAGAWAQATTEPAGKTAASESPAAPLPADSAIAAVEGKAAGPASNIGTVTGNDVFVRSGFNQNYYPVTKLNKGDKVTILGEEFGWLKIAPPAGTYCLVEKDLLDKVDDQTGVANGEAMVYTGSNIVSQRYAKQFRLAKGDKVQLIGETSDGGFYKIQPPAGAALWIKADLVDRGGKAEAKIEKVKPGDLGAELSGTTTKPSGKSKGSAKPSMSPLDSNTTQMDINAIEALIAAESTKPLNERAYEPIIDKLRSLAEQSKDEVAQAYAKTRIKQLQDQMEVVAAVRDIRDLKDKAIATADQIAAARAKIRAGEATPMDDIIVRGEIQASEIYNGKGGRPMRFRMVSPEDRRTLAYIEVPQDSPIDPVQYYGKYVGIRASGRHIMQGVMPPVPIFTVKEIVVQDPLARKAGGEAREASPPQSEVAPPASQPAAEVNLPEPAPTAAGTTSQPAGSGK